MSFSSKTPARLFRRTGVSSFVGLACVLTVAGCEGFLKRVPTDEVHDLPYPTCASPTGTHEVLTERVLRAGSTARDADVVERYRLERRDCHYVATVHQEWSRSVSDVEVVYDLSWKPLRAWKRMLLPGPKPGEPVVDVRRYELRTTPPNMLANTRNGRERFWFRGEAPTAVAGPGRGLVTAWIKKAHLAVGQSVRGPVLDFRSPLERIVVAALRRDPDRIEPTLGGRTVRVYTIFGRESVFADLNDDVIGDLAGLRPAESVHTPMPPAVPAPSPPDPVGTP